MLGELTQAVMTILRKNSYEKIVTKNKFIIL